MTCPFCKAENVTKIQRNYECPLSGVCVPATISYCESCSVSWLSAKDEAAIDRAILEKVIQERNELRTRVDTLMPPPIQMNWDEIETILIKAKPSLLLQSNSLVPNEYAGILMLRPEDMPR